MLSALLVFWLCFDINTLVVVFDVFVFVPRPREKKQISICFKCRHVLYMPTGQKWAANKWVWSAPVHVSTAGASY